MATKFDLTNFTTPTEEQVQNASEVIVKEVFTDSPLTQLHEVQTGIGYDKQIAFADGFDVVGEVISGCTPTEIGDVALTDKHWTPKLMGGRFTFCANDENKLLGIMRKAKNVFPDFFERNTNSPDMALIAGIVMNSIQGSILPKVWFSDTAAALTADGGVFLAGTNLNLFNQIDGLWKQIFADSDIPVYTIDKNAEASYAAQALSSDEALTILKNVYTGADIRLKSDANKQFYVTQTVYENLMFSYAEKGADNGGLTQDIQNGFTSLKYMGVPVVAVNEWDYTINTYEQDGTKWNKPHRVVLSTPNNLPVGTLSSSDLENLEYIYDEVNKTNILDFGYFLDAKMLIDYKVSAAY